MSAATPDGIGADLREAAKKLPVVPTEKFLLQVANEITRLEIEAGDEAYESAVKRVHAQQLQPQQLVQTMLQLLAEGRPRRGRPAKAAAISADAQSGQPNKADLTSGSSETGATGVSGSHEA